MLRRGDPSFLTSALLRLAAYVPCTCDPRYRPLYTDHHAVTCPMYLSARLAAVAVDEGVERTPTLHGIHESLKRRGR